MWFDKKETGEQKVSVTKTGSRISTSSRTPTVSGNGTAGAAMQAQSAQFADALAALKDQATRSQTKIEMLEAKEEAQKELREITNKKFDAILGQIGEIRELFKVLSSEKKELEIKIGQTLEIVKQVQPTEVAKKLSTMAHQISLIEGKNQLLHKQYDSFKKDFDQFSHKLKVFRGDDELLKLQTRVKNDLEDVEKVSHQAGMHAAKIENHFIKINEKATAIQTSISELKALREGLEHLQIDLTKQSEDIKAAASAQADKSGLTGLDEATKKIAELEGTVSELTDLTTETFAQLKKDILSHHEKATSSISPVEFEKMKRWVAYLIKELESRKQKK